MTDGRALRIAEDTDRVFMGRCIQRFYGEEGLDALLACRRETTRRSWARRSAEVARQDPGYLLCLFTPDAHEFTVVEDSPARLEVVVARCVHADVFRSYNAADLGEKLICAGDEAVVAGYNPAMRLRRPTTCMRGECCHFVFEVAEPAP